MKSITELLVPENRVTFTRRMKATPTSQYQPFTVVEGDYEITTITCTITSVDDKGDFWYVGYVPLSPRQGTFGYLRVYKDYITREFGVIDIQ